MTAWVDPTTPNFQYADMIGDLALLYTLVQQLGGNVTPVNLSNYVPAFATIPDGSSLLVYVNGRQQTSVALPTGGRFVGPYAVSTGYVAGNIVTQAGSAYVAPAAFTSTSFAADLAANRLRLFCSAGAPAVNRTGAYNPTQSYNVGDGVTTVRQVTLATGGAASVTDQWCLSVAAPAGTAPAQGSAYWSLVALGSPINSSLVVDTVNGLGNLATALGTIMSKIAAAAAAAALAQKQAAQINTQLGVAKVTGFPLTLATS